MAMLGLVLSGGLVWAWPADVDARTSRPFSAVAAANGARASVTLIGGPGTDVPFDGGGPTAQATANSFGTSAGYAALPDIGQFLVTVPGLITGLFASGAGGLPPIKTPSLPDYPLYVTSDPVLRPEATTGDGPYFLSATSHESETTAEARAGLQTDTAGNAALVRSESSVVRNDDDSVVATAVSEVEGLAIGPLALGAVRSTATAEMSPTGAITFHSSIVVEAARLGGLPIAIGPNGVTLLGVPVDLPIGGTVEKLLSSSGLIVEFIPEQTFADRVVAGSLRVTIPYEMPAPVPPLGQLSGSLTFTIGSATASMTGAVPGQPGPSNGSTPARTVDTPSATSSGAVPPTGLAPAAPASPAASVPVVSTGGAATLAPLDLWDIKLLYLVFVAGCITLMGAGHLVRQLGVRRPWTS